MTCRQCKADVGGRTRLVVEKGAQVVSGGERRTVSTELTFCSSECMAAYSAEHGLA